jgi:hypothetical protein
MRRKTGIGWIEMPQRSSLLPYRGVLSCLSKAREASGSEAARVIRLIFKPVKSALFALKVSNPGRV